MALGERGAHREEGHLPGKCSPAYNFLQLKENRALWLYGNRFASKMENRAFEIVNPTAHTQSPSLGHTVITEQVASPSVIQSESYL